MAAPLPTRGRQVLTAACAAVGAGLAWWRWGGPWLAALAAVALALLALALAVPRAHRPVHALLEGAVRWLLQGLSWLLLGIVFALVFVPGRVVLTLRRRDPLERRPDPAKPTYWREMPAAADPARRFSSQF